MEPDDVEDQPVQWRKGLRRGWSPGRNSGKQPDSGRGRGIGRWGGACGEQVEPGEIRDGREMWATLWEKTEQEYGDRGGGGRACGDWRAGIWEGGVESGAVGWMHRHASVDTQTQPTHAHWQQTHKVTDTHAKAGPPPHTDAQVSRVPAASPPPPACLGCSGRLPPFAGSLPPPPQPVCLPPPAAHAPPTRQSPRRAPSPPSLCALASTQSLTALPLSLSPFASPCLPLVSLPLGLHLSLDLCPQYRAA